MVFITFLTESKEKHLFTYHNVDELKLNKIMKKDIRKSIISLALYSVIMAVYLLTQEDITGIWFIWSAWAVGYLTEFY